MPTAGKTVLTDTGKAGLLSTGKRAVYRADGECPECCGEYVCEFPVQVTLTANVVIEGQAFLDFPGPVTRDTWGNESWSVATQGSGSAHNKLASTIIITISYYGDPRNEYEMVINILTDGASTPYGEYYMEATSSTLCGTYTINDSYGFGDGYISGDITGVSVT